MILISSYKNCVIQGINYKHINVFQFTCVFALLVFRSSRLLKEEFTEHCYCCQSKTRKILLLVGFIDICILYRMMYLRYLQGGQYIIE